jgi:hypothetical protein
MIIAGHQPAYLPWLGYFDKMARCDVFVISDDLQYEPKNFQNRNRIKVNNGASWLTVPVAHAPESARICDIVVSDGAGARGWQQRTWATLRTHYRRAPHFARYADALEDVYARPWRRLVDLDLHLTQLIVGWLGISPTLVRASSLDLQGHKADRIIDTCRRLGADTYLSGSGGSKGYLDVEAMRRAGVRVAWQQFDHPIYPQRYPALGFIPSLSALDLILNCGPASRAILLGAGAPARAEDVAASGGVEIPFRTRSD